MMRLARRGAAGVPLLALVLSLSACDSLLGPPLNGTLAAQLEQGRAIWNEHGITSYDMVVTRARGVQDPIAVHIEVREGQIRSGTFVATGEPVPAEVLAEFRTVEGLFAKVQDAIDRRAPGIFVGYDGDHGFPDQIVIDYDRTRFDDDVSIVVSEFEPVPAG